MTDITMCADQHCTNYATCYRAKATPEPDQRFWAVSPRENDGETCMFYAPVNYTDGASALKEQQ